MNCARNIITANFSGGGTSATTAPLWQWDYGQVLCITGIEDLPAAFEVHFSTNKTGGVSTVAVGADDQVTIPNELLTIGKNLNAWIYLSDAQGEGETEYSITIPVKARPMPETYDAEVTGEFDDVVRQVSEYAQTAQTAADNAGASASAAAASANSAAASASAAETAKTAAETAQGKAENAQAAAETAAQTATEKAQQTAQDAAQAAQNKADAESAAQRAEAAQTGAESAKTDAETAALSAADSASAASASATSAGQSATSAGQSASAAAGSATTAGNAAQTATTKAAEAFASADAAAASETAAQIAQTAAETAATNAGQSASTATTKAAEAAQSASNAAASETAAEAAATRAEQAAASLVVDDALSETSENPVQNKVIDAEVTQLKNALTLAFVSANNYEFGKIDVANTGWSYSASVTRIRIKQGTTIRLYAGDTVGIVANSGVVFSIAWLNDNGIYNSVSGWLTTFTCPVTANYILVARYSREVTITNISDVADNIVINSTVAIKTLRKAHADISTVNGKIKTINSLVGIYNQKESDFDIGNITMSATGWVYSDRDTRVRTKSGTTIQLKQGDVITLTDYTDARMYIGYQKGDGTYEAKGWLTEDYTCPVDGNYIILLCHATDRRLNSVDELLSLLLIFTQVSGGQKGQDNKIPQKYDSKVMELAWDQQSGTNKRVIVEYVDVSEYKCIKYSVPNGYDVSMMFYDENKTQFRNSGWDTTGIGYRLCGGAKYATLQIRKSNETVITPSDITDSFVFELYGHKMYSYANSPFYTIFHRGCDNTAPENTEISYIYAAKERALYVETDIRYTSDGVPVLLHDETINRTGRNADGTSIATTTNIADITYEDALDYDFGIYKGNNFAGQKILTFEQFMSLCSAYELHPVVELKGGITENRVKDLYKTALKYGMKGRISWIGAPGNGILDALTEIDDEVDFYWLTSLTSENVMDAIGYKTSKNRIHMDIYITLSPTLDQSLIDQATEGGVEIAVWMANAESQLKYLFGLRGVTGFATDGTDAVIGLLMEHQS